MPEARRYLFPQSLIFDCVITHVMSMGELSKHLSSTQTANLINVYASQTNAERRIYFHSLLAYISKTEENILGGDFNCIADNKLDKLGGDPSA